MVKIPFLPIALLLTVVPASGQIPGLNVNMVSGTTWPDGDPFLQRQNEPSMAVSSRNPLHILGGANDYRTVDLPGLPGNETGDAWLGVFKSYDGGQTWRSTVHPGCPQSVPQCDGAPFLKSFAAEADPVVRAGTNGMFYLSGIAFTRDTPKKSVVFVSRFVDNNNEENGDPIKYVSTTPVYYGHDAVFVDKPWIAVDIPRAGAGICQIQPAHPNFHHGRAELGRQPMGLQEFPAGNLYLAVTAFTDETRPPSQILFMRSTDCGATWSSPITLADNSLNQGANIAIDPTTGAIYVAWRRFQSPGIGDAIMVAKSTDGGLTFSSPVQVAALAAFDQSTTPFSFRTNDYPTMTVDGSGRVYVAWSERGYGMGGDARIMISTSRDGTAWTQRAMVADFPARGHQFMPAMTFAGGTIMIVFYDLRQDTTVGNFTATGKGQYSETRVPVGDLATDPPHPEKVFTSQVVDFAPASLNEGPLLRRHTLDVWCAQAAPADAPYFTTARISQYIFGSAPNSSAIQQLQVNPPNLPLFEQGTVPFVGDYLDVAAAPWIVPGDQPGTWKFNTAPSNSIAFHAVWTDNRDVRAPANGDWTEYTPPTSAFSGVTSIFDPTKQQPACVPGQAGMRNQNIYTALITEGLLVTSPADSKKLGAIQRAFPVVVTNSTAQSRTYRLSILNQPAGGKASFLQFPTAGYPDPLTVLDLVIPAGSSASRTVFVTAPAPAASVQVSVAEISVVGANTTLPGGFQGSLVLNPDPSNPADSTIGQAELFNPDIANPDIANPDIANPDIANPDIANPDIANPDIANPDIANFGIATPDIANPDIANPDIANPDIANPDIANAAISDATWKVTNNGNATAAYSIHFILNGQIPSRVIWQLVVHKTYATPVGIGCTLTQQPHMVVIANIPHPAFLNQAVLAQSSLGRMIVTAHSPMPVRPGSLRDLAARDVTDSSGDNGTVTIGPGETVYITLRFVNTDKSQPLGFDPGKDITTVIVSQTANTGTTQPPVSSSQLVAVLTTLPAGVAGSSYSASLEAAGGTQPHRWIVSSGQLPPGLSLSPSGQITGTISSSASGTYNFSVQVTDSSAPTEGPVTLDLSIQVSRVALAITSLSAMAPGGAYAKPGDSITLNLTVTNSGGAADAVTPVVSVNATGTAAASCNPPSPASAAIAAAGSQNYTVACGPVAGAGTLSFSVSLTARDHLTGAAISVSPAISNTITVLGAPPKIAVAATAGGQPYTSGTWTNKQVVVTFTCTPAVGDATTKILTVVSEGANQSIGSTCTDLAGNTSSASFTGIDIDFTPPQIGVIYSGGYLPGNWSTQPVSVTFTCTDTLSGVAAGYPTGSMSLASDTTAGGTTVTGICQDRAGNSSTLAAGPIKIDREAPVIASQVSPAVPASGWYTAVPVTVGFTCTDALSGVAAGYPAGGTTLSGDTAGTTITGTCRDIAGNVATTVVGPIRIDREPPGIQFASALPAANAAGWNNTPVTLTWQCTDAVSGPVSATVTQTVSTQGANLSATGTCTDRAGLTASNIHAGIDIDTTPPLVLRFISPIDGYTYMQGSAVAANYRCEDALSGLASCTGAVPNGQHIDTSTPGTFTFTVTATDAAGNKTQVSHTYNVAAAN